MIPDEHVGARRRVTSWDDENACHGAHMVQPGHWTMEPHHFADCHAYMPPSVPVESREQPRDWYGFAAMFVRDHQPEPGGCTCGFCAWSVEHVAVSLAIELQRMRDATIHELRAEAAREFESGNEWCQRALAAEAALETTLAERDRARYLAAHLEEQLARLQAGIQGDIDSQRLLGFRFVPSPALTAHLEAEHAQ